MQATIVSSEQRLRGVTQHNAELILSGIEQLGGNATSKELRKFFWRPENQIRFQREGESWSDHYAQRDCHYCMQAGLIVGIREGPRYRYFLAQSKIMVNQ